LLTLGRCVYVLRSLVSLFVIAAEAVVAVVVVVASSVANGLTGATLGGSGGGVCVCVGVVVERGGEGFVDCDSD